ncbi:MAG: GIN domain-containing protein [Flavobacteriales bacterium]
MAQKIIQHRLFIAAMLLVLFCACNKEQAPDCFKKAGDDITITRTLEDFESIEWRDYLQIELVSAPEQKIEITGPKNILPKISTEVEEGRLYIENKNTCNVVRSFNRLITLRIYSPDFPLLINRGQGDVTLIDTLSCEHFQIENHHSAGLISGVLQCDTVKLITHTGPVDITLKGQSLHTEIFAQGIGYMDMGQLRSNAVLVNNSSINDVKVYPTQYLFAYIASRGNIYRKTGTYSINKSIEGSGRVIEFD